MFSWVSIYKELAHKILDFQDNQKDLIDLLKEMKQSGIPVINLKDLGADGKRNVDLSVIDPFTFFSVFNRGITNKNRCKILKYLKEKLILKSSIPNDFDGIPVVMNTASWFFWTADRRKKEDVLNLWKLAKEAVTTGKVPESLFDGCLLIRGVGVAKITVGLFWMRPNSFMPFDRHSQKHLSQKNIQKEVSSSTDYKELLQTINNVIGNDYKSISYEAYHGDPVEPYSNAQHWQIAPGENAKLWGELKKLSIAAVGFKKINADLSGISESKFKTLFQKHYPELSTIKQTQLWNFINLKPGDKFITNKGKKLLLGVGEVKNGYKYMPEREEYNHTVGVKYYRVSEDGIPIPDKFKGKFGKTITKLKMDDFEEMESLFNGDPPLLSAKNFWWLSANPKIWNPSDHEIGQKQIYTSKNEKGHKRRIYKNFEEVKPGDLIVGYVASPIKEVATLSKVTKELFDTPEGEGFEFEKIEQFEVPVSLKEMQAVPDLKKSEPFRNNNQGSLFKLTENEFETIRAIVDEKSLEKKKQVVEPYSTEKELETIFLSKQKFADVVNLLKYKKNIILQGPPGVGKTFIAKHIAWAMLGKKDESKIQMVQFHQSYSYEDFVQGFRPDDDGQFYLKDGIFYTFCKNARSDLQSEYFFIIDEINRGNLSKILGELMILIEADKRGKIEIPLTYSKTDDETFMVPPNVHLIGTMNTADRSLAMVDYALRRRFCFVDLYPAYNSEKFNSFLKSSGVKPELIEKINLNLTKVNKIIKNEDKNLGPGFRIGHSYFCSFENEDTFDEAWYKRVVEYEIAPLLREYWFDNSDKADDQINVLLT